MNTYFTVEEKYLQAIEEVSYGKKLEGFRMLKEIVDNDPLFARAHYQLGKLYYYQLDDYQAAGYHFKTCMELEPSFPDNYYDYLCLVVFLDMEKLVNKVVTKALTVPGVNTADIYERFGLFFEKNKNWQKALDAYENAFIEVTHKGDADDIKDNIKRVKRKVERSQTYQHQLTG